MDFILQVCDTYIPPYSHSTPSGTQTKHYNITFELIYHLLKLLDLFPNWDT